MYFFDEYDEYFRSPGGAVKTPGELRLRIKLRRGLATGAKVFARSDDGSEQKAANMRFIGVSGTYDIYEYTFGFDKSGLYWYHFMVDLADGSEASVPEQYGGAFQVTVYTHVTRAPYWIQGGVIYHIFVDRFKRGAVLNLRPGAVYRDDWGGLPHFLPDEEGIMRNDDFFGGDLYGVIEKLPFLKEMGVTCIYLSPVFEAASNHKYDVGDFMKVDSSFGGDKALEKLCSSARENGIRVVLDGVFNHVGADSRYFNRYGSYEELGAYQSEQSPYRDWFTFSNDGTYESWWGIELLPSLNKRNTDYIDFICGDDGVIAHWSKKGISGWRLDVVDELPDTLLDPLCQAIKRSRSDALIVGEVWEDASNKIAYDVRRRYFLGGQLDSVMNYPLREAIIDCVRDGQTERLASLMASLRQNYPDNILNSLMNVLSTHDTVRILTILSGAALPQSREEMAHFSLDSNQLETAKRRLKLASALQFTLPGVPCVFYGDEAGVEGGADPFCRSCYPWGNEDTDIVAWYARLARLRSELECFKSGRYELIQAGDGLFAFTRGQGRGRVLVAVNVSDEDKEVAAQGFNFELLSNEYTGTLTVKAGQTALFAINKSR